MNKENIVKYVKARLYSSGKLKSLDKDGKEVYVDSDVFSDEQYETYIEMSTLTLKQMLKLSDNDLVNYQDMIVHGAVVIALGAQALKERGREYSMNDGGIDFVPPNVSEMLYLQWLHESNSYFEKLRMLQNYDEKF